MKILDLLEEIKKKESFSKFLQLNPDAFLAAIFAVLDDSGKDTYQLDYFIPSKNKIAISSYPFEDITIQPDEIKEAKVLSSEQKIDITQLRDKVEEIKNENELNKIKITKIIAILKDDNWSLTCLSPTLDIIQIAIDKEGNTTKCKKAGLMDFVIKK